MNASFLGLGAFTLLLSLTACAHSPPGPNSAAAEAAEQTFDRLAIRELLERFSDAVNHGHFEIIPTLFTEDAVWEAKIAPDERAEPPSYTVLPGPIELHGNGRASSRSTMYELLHIKVNGTVLDLVGTYSDTFVEHDGVWRFASRSFRLRYAAEATPPKYRVPF